MQETVSPVDFNGLWEISDGKKSTLIDILISIEKGLNSYPELIANAYKNNDVKELREISHKTKSCTNYLFHTELTDLLEEIEDDALNNQVNETTGLKVERVCLIMEVIYPDIASHLKELQSL